jgi:hypothetical protein
MNDSEFEKRLRSEPLRQIPPEWRAEILQGTARSQPSTLDHRPSVVSLPLLGTLKLWRELIWPARRVWTGFALVWVAIVAINLADAEQSGKLEANAKVPLGNLITVWERQQELLTELNGVENPDMDKPRQSISKPRSEGPSLEATV